MIRKRAELDTVNPPGQIVNRPPAHMEKPLQGHIQEFMDTEEMFTPHPPSRKCMCVDCEPSFRKDK